MTETTTLPTRRDEAWRYADISALEKLGVEALDEWKEITLEVGQTRRDAMVVGSGAPELHRIRLTLGE
ncbi:MAG: SufD family Fe-S cluster assembly protein, partial [Pseudomonadota bacterium]